MAVHRYWRVVDLRTAGGVGALDLSEARLYDASGLADAAATLTATIAPASGTLADLADGSAASAVSWPFAAWSTPGFALTWDFGGTTKDITGLRLGSGAAASTFPEGVTLMWSDDASNWTASASANDIVYPGANALTAVPSGGSLIAVNGAAKPRAWVTPAFMVTSRITSPVVPPASAPYYASQGVPRVKVVFDAVYGGKGRVYGTVKEKHTPSNTPLHRRVLLMDQRSQIVVRETWSDPATGNFEFSYVRMGIAYTVIAFDYLQNYRAVVADNQLAEAM